MCLRGSVLRVEEQSPAPDKLSSAELPIVNRCSAPVIELASRATSGHYALPMTAAILRASTENGAVWDDPSEDMLFILLEDVQRGDESHFVVERLADASGQTYIQVIQDGRGGWTIERREGGPDRHFTVTVPDLRQAHAAMTAWAFELPLVPPAAAWSRLTI